MSNDNSSQNMAIFCDFENIALGVRDFSDKPFSMKLVLERLLLKGNIVVKKAYADWDRYQSFKAPMHEAAFELIEIPHVRQSGKNSADIRMVVDALDLCYTKSHVNTFVILSGDSDFSPLVSKLRENNKTVVGVGVKSSTSDLLTSNCDEFIFYDDLAGRAGPTRKKKAKAKSKKKKSAMSEDEKRPRRRHSGLGLHDQADTEAPPARIQRAVPWLPVVRCASGGSRQSRIAAASARREVRRLYRHRSILIRSCQPGHSPGRGLKR